MSDDRCRCGCTAADRAATAVCRIPGCPYPEIAEQRPPSRLGKIVTSTAAPPRFEPTRVKRDVAMADLPAGFCPVVIRP